MPFDCYDTQNRPESLTLWDIFVNPYRVGYTVSMMLRSSTCTRSSNHAGNRSIYSVTCWPAWNGSPRHSETRQYIPAQRPGRWGLETRQPQLLRSARETILDGDPETRLVLQSSISSWLCGSRLASASDFPTLLSCGIGRFMGHVSPPNS
jgi:hypothetical protein